MRIRPVAVLVLWGLSWTACAGDNLTLDSAIGGGIGGAAGGAIGAELGGREGAIIGSGLGAAVGTAINTRDHDGSETRNPAPAPNNQGSAYYAPPQRGTFCPPGQAKKGRC
jgi:hypothetical protein